MTDDEIYEIARKRAGYALATIADRQMNTWEKYPSSDSPIEIIARQIAAAMNDALKAPFKAERERCAQVIRDCPGLDENGYICEKSAALKGILQS